MKKLLGGILALGLLAGCSSNNASTGTVEKQKQQPAKQAQQKTVDNPKKDENGDYVLEKVGQKATTEQATAELLKIKNVNEIVNVSPINVTIKDIKLIKLTNISDDMKGQIELFTGKKVNGPVTYLQIRFDAENIEEKNVDWDGIQTVVTDKQEQIDANNKNFLDSDWQIGFMGKVKQSGQYGLILTPGQEDISKVKLIIDGSSDDSSFETITPEQQVEYSF
jgi:hypothetical protein